MDSLEHKKAMIQSFLEKAHQRKVTLFNLLQEHEEKICRISREYRELLDEICISENKLKKMANSCQ